MYTTAARQTHNIATVCLQPIAHRDTYCRHTCWLLMTYNSYTLIAFQRETQIAGVNIGKQAESCHMEVQDVQTIYSLL